MPCEIDAAYHAVGVHELLDVLLKGYRPRLGGQFIVEPLPPRTETHRQEQAFACVRERSKHSRGHAAPTLESTHPIHRLHPWFAAERDWFARQKLLHFLAGH